MFDYTYPGSYYGSCPTPFQGSSCCPTDHSMPYGGFNGYNGFNGYGYNGFNGYGFNGFNGYKGFNGYGYNTPSSGYNTPSSGWNTPSYGWNTPSYGWNTPSYGWNTPFYGFNTPSYGYNTPVSSWNTPHFPTATMQYQGYAAAPGYGHFSQNGVGDSDACAMNNTIHGGAYGFGEQTVKKDVA